MADNDSEFFEWLYDSISTQRDHLFDPDTHKSLHSVVIDKKGTRQWEHSARPGEVYNTAIAGKVEDASQAGVYAAMVRAPAADVCIRSFARSLSS